MAKDMLGAEVEVGDTGVYVTSGRYTTRGIVEILAVKNRATVRWIKSDRTQYSDGSFTIDTSSLVLVDKFKGAVIADAPRK